MAEVVNVSARRGHGVGKAQQLSIRLIAGQGVEGDAHCGEKVKHRSRARFDPALPNLRQVHLIHAELLDELAVKGFDIVPGELGENILTSGIDLLALSAGAVLAIGDTRIKITGLRNPCVQLERHKAGLMDAVLDRDADGNLIRKCGVMGVVINGGDVRPGHAIEIKPPDGARESLKPV
jgi:MOSC domain-containing protein YiiM